MPEKKDFKDIIVRPGSKKMNISRSNPMTAAEVMKKFGKPRKKSGKVANLLWCVDKTGSMYSLIQKAKSASAEFFRRSQDSGIILNVCWSPFGDYVDYRTFGPLGLIENREWTQDVSQLEQFIEQTRLVDGGDADEAVEFVLAHALAEPQPIDAVILVGDAGPHDAKEAQRQIRLYGVPTQFSLDWQENAKALGDRGIPVYTFAMRGGCRNIFHEIAELSGGQTGDLDHLDDLINMLSLTAMAVSGNKQDIQKYLERYQGEMSSQAIEFAERLYLGVKSES